MPNNATEFTFGQISRASGLSNTTLNKWAYEEHFPTIGSKLLAAGKGNARQISYLTTLAIIIMGELSRRGVPLKTASLAAKRFAYGGDSQRREGEVFKDGLTFLVIHGEKEELKYKLLNIDPAKSFRTIWDQLLNISEGAGATVVNLNELLWTRVGSIGIDQEQFESK